MKLSRSDKNTLVLSIAELLQSTTLRKNGAFVFPDAWDSDLKAGLDEKFSASLNRILDRSKMTGLIRRELRYILAKSGESLPAESTNLSKIACFSDSFKISRQIVSIIENLPNQYRLLVRFSSEFGDLSKRSDINVKISDQLRVVSGALISDELKFLHDNEEIDRYIRNGNADLGKKFILDEATLYFEYRASGYIGDRSSSNLVGDFMDVLRSFFGACFCHNIILSWSISEDQPIPIIAGNEIISSDVEELCYLDIADADIAKAINFATSKITDEKLESGILVAEILNPIITMFGAEESNRLKVASIWMFRAFMGQNNMDRILESSIAIEVLLGDRETSDRVGLSKLLANRCAYSLGDSAKERKEMVDFFVEFYRLRSEIVHSGRYKLLEEEKQIVTKGKLLAARILKHEIGLHAQI